VKKEAKDLLTDLEAAGWTVSFARYDAEDFGNWYIDLQCRNQTIRVAKDRGQFMLYGPADSEIPIGLERAFDSFDEFHRSIVSWARAQHRS